MKRTFAYDGTKAGKQSFEIVTELTDDQAIERLGGLNGVGFRCDAAFEIHKMQHGYKHKSNLVAWGFKMAEDAGKPGESLTLAAGVRKMVGFRKPVRGVADGESYEVKLCGSNSSHPGEYAITDGGPFRANRFYGYAKQDGTWQPTHKCPASVKLALTGGK